MLGVIYFSYRDIEGKRDELTQVDADAEVLSLRHGILPGGYGGADLHVSGMAYGLGIATLVIVFITDYELTTVQEIEICQRAAKISGYDQVRIEIIDLPG